MVGKSWKSQTLVNVPISLNYRAKDNRKCAHQDRDKEKKKKKAN